MKVPNIFTSEKNLEEKTERLLEGEAKPSEPKPAILRCELEELLSLFDRKPEQVLHTKIESSITKSGYAPVKVKGLRWDYWTKPTDYDEDYVFTKWFDRKNTRYAFATVEKGKVEEFCERFEQDHMTKLFGLAYNRILSLMTSTFIGSASIGLATKYIYFPHQLGIDSASAVSCMALLGAVYGFIQGTIWLQYRSSINKKKLKMCHKSLVTSDRDAVKMAFN